VASKLKDTALDFGFVQVPVAIFPACQDDELSLSSLCHGKAPKMTIKCEEGGEEYRSWNKVPERGYKWAEGEYIILTPEEIAEAKAQRPKVDSMKVEKAVDFLKVGTRYGFDQPYRVMPPEKANETSRAAYRAVYETIKETGKAVLVKFAPRDKVRHYALIADEDGVILAYPIVEKRPLPYPVPTTPADKKTKTQAALTIQSVESDDPVFEQEPDPIFDLVQKKLTEKSLIPGIGETTLIPQ